MKEPGKLKRIALMLAKIVGWFVFSVILLLLAIAGAIQIPAVQNRIVQRAVAFLEDKIKTEVRLEHISLSFPKRIVLTGLYLEDQAADTLLYAGKLSVDTDLWGLTRREIQLNDITLDNLHAYVHRPLHDSAFNFNYIITAFAGEPEPNVPEDTTIGAPWAFSIGEVALNKARVAFQDSLSGNLIDARIGLLAVDLDLFDLNTMAFKANSIELSGIDATVTQTKAPAPADPEPDTTESDSLGLSLDADEIKLSNIRALYTQEALGQVARLDLEALEVEPRTIDLEKQTIDLALLRLTNTFVSYQQMAARQQPAKQQEAAPVAADSSTDEALIPWNVRVTDVDLSGISLQYHDFNQPVQPAGMDFSHLWVSQFGLQARDLDAAGSVVQGTITNLSLREKSGFSVRTFSGAFALSDTAVQINDMRLATEATSVNIAGEAHFASLASLANTYPKARIKLDVRSSTLALGDLLFFSPTLLDSLPITLPANALVRADIACTGTVNNLNLEKIVVEALNDTRLQLNGKLQGLPDLKQTQFTVALEKLYTTRRDVMSIAGDSLIPASITVPQWLNLAGDFKGSMIKPDVRAVLTSAIGTARVDARLNLDPAIRKENYNAKVALKKFALGTLLNQPALGNVDLTTSVVGSGLEVKDLHAKIKLLIQHLEYNGYDYRDFKLDGSMDRYFFSGVALLEDKNLDMKLTADLDYRKDVPRYKAKFELKNADFAALQLTERPLRMRGTVEANLATSDFKVINGNVDIRKVAVFNGDALYAVDSLLFASIDQKGQSEVKLRSDILSGDFKGTINLAGLPQTVRRHFNNYFNLQDTALQKFTEPQDFSFSLVIKNTDLLTEVLLPDLEPFIPGELRGEFDSREDRLDLHFDISRIKYAAVGVDSIVLDITSDKKSLSYDFAVRDLRADTLRIYQLGLSGNVARDSIRTKFLVLDSLEKEKYVLGGVFNSLKNVFQFRFLPNEVMLNYEPWQTPQDNYLRFAGTGLDPHNFSIAKGDEQIALADSKDSTLALIFKTVDLQNITRIVEGTTPIGGIIDGDMNLSRAGSGAFNTNLKVSDLMLMEQTWGDLRLALGRTAKGPLNLDLRIEGEHADLMLDGYYESTLADPAIHLKLVIQKLELAIAEPLTLGQLKNMKGGLIGEVKVEGPTRDPDISGYVTFKDATVTATAVNSAFTLRDETITVTGEGISFDNFEIRDAKDNLATLGGDIKSTKFNRYRLNLDFNADGFQLLNSTEDDNDLFYGTVGLNARIRIRGNSNQPRVDMQASLTEGSIFTYVVPTAEKSILDQKGIVNFVDKDAYKDPFLANIKPSDTLRSSFKGFSLNANIELTDSETFNVVIDPITGDKLSVNGNSTLNLTMSPSGDMQLSGRYEVTKGSYNLSFYKLVKRTFTIEKGGSITWTGDPLAAILDLRALYQVETSPVDLMAGPGMDPSSLNQFRERVMFYVYLQLKGDLMAPEVSFKLDMQENRKNVNGGVVYARIEDINTRESDLNKQVFALLVLKRFITENPLESEGESDVEGSARRSVGRLLAEQLNRLSENVKGVKLTFDVKSYETYDNANSDVNRATELQLGLQKSLFDDRLVVKVSGNVDVEGQSNQNSAADYIGDLALEYKITEDGRFRITGFRNSNYDMIDGDLIETGAGLIYIKDYNTFRELFKANEVPKKATDRSDKKSDKKNEKSKNNETLLRDSEKPPEDDEQ